MNERTLPFVPQPGKIILQVDLVDTQKAREFLAWSSENNIAYQHSTKTFWAVDVEFNNVFEVLRWL